MDILKQSQTIKRTLDMKEEKMMIVLSWLLEFRFSTTKILSSLLENNKNTSFFFSGLVNDGFIKQVVNVHTRNERLLMLTKQGVDFLEARELDISNAMTASGRLERYSMVLHDTGVQKFVSSKKERFLEVVMDRNIIGINDKNRPDALLKLKKNGNWVGIEYERWRKSTARVFMSFVNQSNQLTRGNYGGVYFVFNTEIDQEYYMNLFNYERWPLFIKDQNTGKLKASGAYFDPNKVENLRRVFKFEVLACE